MDDLPEKLRALYVAYGTDYVQTAANEIESLRQRLAECERERVFQANAHKMAQDALLEQGQQLATVTKERDELVEVVSKAVKLNSFREFNDHIPAMKAALAKLGADKTGEKE